MRRVHDLAADELRLLRATTRAATARARVQICAAVAARSRASRARRARPPATRRAARSIRPRRSGAGGRDRRPGRDRGSRRPPAWRCAATSRGPSRLYPDMKVRVLGSCAGGGLPQWNCGGANSVRARRGDPDVPARTQPGLAVSADGVRWSILNAGPDLRSQLAAFPALHPKPGTRDVPLDTVALTSAELDHVLGLLVLREALSFRIVSTHGARRDPRATADLRIARPARGRSPVARRHLRECRANTRSRSRRRTGASRRAESRAARPSSTPPVFARPHRRALEARFCPVRPKVPGLRARRGRSRTRRRTTGLRITDLASGARLAFVPRPRLSSTRPRRPSSRAADVRFEDGCALRRGALPPPPPGSCHARGRAGARARSRVPTAPLAALAG